MRFILGLLLIIFTFSIGRAQDSLWLHQQGSKLYVTHFITNNENIFALGRMYHLPLAEIANNNNDLYAKGFRNGDAVKIPLTKSNYITDSTADNKQKLYYVVKNNETLLIISKTLGVRQGLVQTWNNLPTPHVQNGQVIHVGWITYTADGAGASSNFEKNNNTLDITSKDLSAYAKMEASYYENVNEENEQGGAVVFYNPKVTLEEDVYYALHATLPKGQIIKVTNPESNTYIFVTVIGVLPVTEEFQNAMLAISQNAAIALKSPTKRVFCKLFYKP